MLPEAPADVVDRGKTRVVQVDRDECDACPPDAHVRAYVYAELPSGRSIAMCSHHGTRHWAALNAQAVVVIDLRDQVLAQPIIITQDD